MLHPFKMSLLLLVGMVGFDLYSAPSLLFFLAEKNTVRIESYSLDELQAVNFISNKISSDHCLHVLKLGTKSSIVHELMWDTNHPERISITMQGKKNQTMCNLHWHSLLITDADCLNHVKYVPGLLCEIEEKDNSYTTEYRSQILLQLDEQSDTLAFVFERGITSGCVLLVADGSVNTQISKKSLTKNDVEALGVLSHDQIHNNSDNEQPQPHITIEVEQDIPTVAVAQEAAQENNQPVEEVVVQPIVQEVPEQYNVYAHAAHPVTVTVTNPVFNKPWHKQWYSYAQTKVAAVVTYLQKLFKR